jgi:site-specific recombinase XerD
MKTKSTFGTFYFLRKSKSRKEDSIYQIYVKITIDGESTEISLKEEIEKKYWDSKRGLAIGKSDNMKRLNTHLEEVRSNIVECYRQLKLNHKLISATAVKKLYLGEAEKEHSLLSVFDYHNQEMKRELEPGTQKNYFTTKRYFESFLKKQFRTDDIYLTQLNYKFIKDFEKFVKENPLDLKKPCTQNGTMKHIERLKKVVHMALKNEWIERDPFDKYSAKFIKVDRGYLTDFELRAIEEKEFTIDRLQIVRDLFIFSCYTGLAYIDVMKLTNKDVRRGIDGGYWLFSARKKNKNNTVVEVKIPFLPKAFQIVEYYKKHPKVINTGRLLPSMTNQTLNTYLKEIADVCYIEKNLSFHLARHTFATTVTLTNKVPIETVSKLLGHSSLRTTQIYAKVIDQKLSNDMKDLQKLLEESAKRKTGS